MERIAHFLAIFSICLGISFVAMDWAIVNTALGSIQRDLSCSFAQLQWVMNAFALILTACLFTMGKLLDRFGRRKFFIIGLFIWSLSTLLAGLSPNIYFLIVTRGLQGLGAALVLPGSQVLMIHAYPDELKTRATSVWATIAGMGLVLGPILGGVIVSFLSWRYIFFFTFPFAFVSAFGCWKFVKESKNEEDTAPLDIKGLLLLLLSLGVLIYTIIDLPRAGIISWTSGIGFAIALIGFAIFASIEVHQKAPIINFRLFVNREFFACSLTNFAILAIAWLAFFLIPLYLQSILQFAPYQAGLVLVILALAMTICSFLGGRIHKLAKRLILLGLISLFLGSIIQFITPLHLYLWQVMLACLFLGIGWGLAFAPAIALGITSLPKQMAGVASGAQTTIAEMGAALGLAIGGALFRTVEKHKLIELFAEEKISIDRTKVTLLHSLLSAPEEAKKVLSSLGVEAEKIFGLFRASFIEGYQFANLFSACIAASVFFLALFALRQAKRNAS